MHLNDPGFDILYGSLWYKSLELQNMVRFVSPAGWREECIDQLAESLAVNPEICEQVKESYSRDEWMQCPC